MNTKTRTLLKQIDGELNALIKHLEQFSEDDLNWKPALNKWSVLQIMYHLMQAELLSLKYVQKKLSFKPTLKNAGIIAATRSILLRLTFSMPVKLKSPKIIDGHHLPKGTTFNALATQWRTQRKLLNDYFETLPDELFHKVIYKHPFAGRMTLNAMISFYRIHFKRHKFQMLHTLKEKGSNI